MIKVKKYFTLFICLVLCFFAFSCDSRNKEYFYSFTDELGNEVSLEKKPTRVVSLLGSFAEVFLLSGGELVGITSDVLDENRFQINENMEIIGTVKHPNIEKVFSLNPDFLILSADIASQVALSSTLDNAKIPHAYFKVESFLDYLSLLKTLTEINGRPDLYEQNGLKVKQDIEKTLKSVEGKPKSSALLLRVFSSGAKAKGDDNFVSAMLKDFSISNIATLNPSILTELSQEIIIKENPTFILATSMGSEATAKKVFENLLKQPTWAGLDAVKNNKSVMLPKNLFHYKPNAKWGEAYEYLKKVLFA